jgi:hypothetical protein
MSRIVSSAVAASKTAAASGRWAAAIGCGASAVPSIMPGSSSPVAAHDLIEINSNDFRDAEFFKHPRDQAQVISLNF